MPHVSLARTFVDARRTPRKPFVTISGRHFAMFLQPQVFLQAPLVLRLPR